VVGCTKSSSLLATRWVACPGCSCWCKQGGGATAARVSVVAGFQWCAHSQHCHFEQQPRVWSALCGPECMGASQRLVAIGTLEHCCMPRALASVWAGPRETPWELFAPCRVAAWGGSDKAHAMHAADVVGCCCDGLGTFHLGTCHCTGTSSRAQWSVTQPMQRPKRGCGGAPLCAHNTTTHVRTRHPEQVCTCLEWVSKQG
jgi:hypothetical protein